MAQTPEAKKLQDLVDSTTQQKTIAENQKAIAEAQKATIAATVPKGDTKPLDGTITTDANFGYLSELVGYRAMKENAQAVGREIGKKVAALSASMGQKGKILIVNDLDFASADLVAVQLECALQSVEDKLEGQIGINDAFIKKYTQPPKIPLERGIELGFELAAGTISAIADIMSYFRTDYNIKDQKFTLDQQAINSIIAGNIINENVQVFINNFYMLKQTKTWGRLENIATLNEKLTQSITSLNDLKKDPKLSSADRASADSKIADSEKLSKDLSTFLDSIVKAPDDKTLPLLVRAATREQIREMGITHLLNLKVTSSGGEAITKRSIWFWTSKATFIGGTAISYMLVKSEGEVVMANTLFGLAQLDYNLWSQTTTYKKIQFGP